MNINDARKKTNKCSRARNGRGGCFTFAQAIRKAWALCAKKSREDCIDGAMANLSCYGEWGAMADGEI